MTTRKAQAPAQRHVRGAWSMLNPAARVVCLICGETFEEDDPFWGCAACGSRAPLTIAYDDPDGGNRALSPVDATATARHAYALFTKSEKTVAAWKTPLTASPRLGPNVYLKQETFSLTNSHKDRYQVIASRMARAMGKRGVVASSTGNHGVSAAAHAATVGLPSVVFCHQDAPAGLLRAIGAFGGIPVQLPSIEQREALLALVSTGWFPATSIDPVLTGAANPFAPEGYRAVAYETVEQLGRLPDAFFIPTAGGDTYYGIAKGFAEVAELSGKPMPAIVAIQPEGANSLSRSIAAGRQVTLDHPASIALSLADEQTGRHTMAAVARWNGRVVDVSEAAIRAAITDLAAIGTYSDPASAAALAGYRLMLATGAIASDAVSVLLLTSSGFKWPDAMAEVFPAGAVQSGAELQRRLTME